MSAARDEEEGKRIGLVERAVEKCNSSSHPLMRIMKMKDVRSCILSFAGEVSRLPVAFLTLQFLRENEGEERKHLVNLIRMDWRRSKEESKFTEEVSKSLSLYHWYIDERMFIVDRSYNGNVKCESDPYVEDVSYDTAVWYFDNKLNFGFKRIQGYQILEWAELKERDRKLGFRTWKYNWEIGFHDDPRNYWLALYYGKVEMSDLPLNPINVTLSIRRGKWDMARKFLDRGDADYIDGKEIVSLGPQGIHFMLSNRELGDRIWPQDVKREEDIIALIEEGVLLMELFHSRYYASLEVLSKYKERICMAMVEDLFIIACTRAYDQDVDDGLEDVHGKIDSILYPFSTALKLEKYSKIIPKSYFMKGSSDDELRSTISMIRRGDDKEVVKKVIISAMRRIRGKK